MTYDKVMVLGRYLETGDLVEAQHHPPGTEALVVEVFSGAKPPLDLSHFLLTTNEKPQLGHHRLRLKRNLLRLEGETPEEGNNFLKTRNCVPLTVINSPLSKLNQ